MEVLAYIMGGINLVLGIFITLIRSIDDHLIDARHSILDELSLAYKEFGDTISTNNVDMGRLGSAIKRLQHLHFACHADINRINTISHMQTFTLLYIIISIIIALSSILIGLFLLTTQPPNARLIFLIVIPFIILVIELIILVAILRTEKYLKEVKVHYRNLEYFT